jgi:hypothetical protein
VNALLANVRRVFRIGRIIIFGKRDLQEETSAIVEGRVTLEIQGIRGKVTSGKLYLMA